VNPAPKLGTLYTSLVVLKQTVSDAAIGPTTIGAGFVSVAVPETVQPAASTIVKLYTPAHKLIGVNPV
jgi:hypothetical protein